MTPRLRVGMYTTVGPRCGIASYTEDLIGALTDSITDHIEVTTIPLAAGSLNPFRQLAAGRGLTRHDIAHVQHTYSFFGVDHLSYTLLIRTLFARIRVPLVLTAHTVRAPGPARFEGGLGSRCANAVDASAWLDLKTFRQPHAVIVHTAHHNQLLVSRQVTADRIHVIPPGIPARIKVPAVATERFRARFGIPTGVPTVGVFGFLEGSKRFTDVLDAVARLPQRPFLVLAGGPRLPAHDTVQHAVMAEAERLHVAERVVVTGYLEPEEVPAALEAMDLVVVPYATDQSMSYSLHRALGQGRPVVATDRPAFREVQKRGSCLVLVDPSEHSALREALGRLLEDPEARAALAAEARAYAVREGVQTAAIRTVSVYRQLQQAR